MSISERQHRNSILKAVKNYKIIFFFIFVCAIRVIITTKCATIHVNTDEILFFKFAQAYAAGEVNIIRGVQTSYSRILYPLIMSIGFIISPNPLNAYKFITVVNALIISLSVFPIYGIAKKILSKERNVYLVLFFCTILMPEMNSSIFVMQESLFLPMILSAFYLLFCIMELPNNSHTMAFAILGFLGALLYVTKEIGLFFIVAVLFGLPFFLLKEGYSFHNTLTSIIIFGFFCGTPVVVYRYILNKHIDSPFLSTSASIANRIITNLMSPEAYSGIPEYVVLYLCSFIIATGIVPVIVIAVYHDKLSSCAQAILNFLCVYISVALVVVYEDLHSEVVGNRFHYRYLFHIFPIILTLCISLFEKIDEVKNKRIIPVAFIFFGAFSVYSGYKVGSVVDCMSLWLIIEHEVVNDAKMHALITFAAITMLIIIICIYRNYNNALKALSLLIILGIFVISDIVFLNYMYKSQENTMYANNMHDAAILNEYFESNSIFYDGENAKEVLLISNDISSFEVFIEPAYIYTSIDDFIENWKENGELNFDNMPYRGRNRFAQGYYLEEYDSPNYIISDNKFDLLGYEEADLGLKEKYLYIKNNADEPNIQSMSSGITADGWCLEDGMDVWFTSPDNTDYEEIQMELDNYLFPNGIDIYMYDDSGYYSETSLVYGNNVVNVKVYREGESSLYHLNIKPTKWREAKNDPRHLAIHVSSLGIE